MVFKPELASAKLGMHHELELASYFLLLGGEKEKEEEGVRLSTLPPNFAIMRYNLP
jgi:hypothetical protein